jgi:lysophospholipase L1-like esterase
VVIVTLLVLIVLFVAFEALYIKYNGAAGVEPVTPRGLHTLGTGPKLSYVVMGDSTAVTQGGEYARGYSVQSATYLAKDHAVSWANVAVSGARAKDVADKQLPQALGFNPDIVLIAVGANDVTHFTANGAVVASLAHTVDTLRSQNSQVKIIFTGAPDMGSVPRFPQPARWYAGVRTQSLNTEIRALAAEKHVTFAPIAAETGPYFRKHPEAFASDKFHPNDLGYAQWTPVIIKALQQ